MTCKLLEESCQESIYKREHDSRLESHTDSENVLNVLARVDRIR